MTFHLVELARGVRRRKHRLVDEPGNWVLYKCFYRQGREHGEFFLNLNLKTLKAEIEGKDPWHAPVLVKAFREEMLWGIR